MKTVPRPGGEQEAPGRWTEARALQVLVPVLQLDLEAIPLALGVDVE
jgi:hypothetical protein